MNKICFDWKSSLISLIVSAIIFEVIIAQQNLSPFKGRSDASRSLSFTIISPDANTLTLYYDNDPSWRLWKDEQSISRTVAISSAPQKVLFDLPNDELYGLKLDLKNKSSDLVFTEIEIVTRSGNTCSWGPNKVLQYFQERTYTVDRLDLKPDGLHMGVTAPGGGIFNQDYFIELDCDFEAASKPISRLFQIGLAAIVWFLGAIIFYRSVEKNIKVTDVGIVAIGIVLISFPLIGLLSGLGNRYILLENRYLTPWPKVPSTVTEFNRFPEDLQKYFEDHFGWRSELINQSHQLKYNVLGVSPIDYVMIGEGGWFYYRAEKTILDYQGLVPFSNTELKQIHSKVKEFKRELDWQSIYFLLSVAPNKHTIYPEYLPNNIHKVSNTTRMDQWMAYNQKHGNYPVLDLRPTLLSHKDPTPVYFLTDTHWNSLGAYYAYHEIIDQLSEQFPSLTPHDISDYRILDSWGPGRDLAQIGVFKYQFLEREINLMPLYRSRSRPGILPLRPNDPLAVVQEIDDPSLPTAVIFHDSFGVILRNYLKEHFRRVTFYALPEVDPELVAYEKPDIVLVILVERSLVQFTK